MIDPNLAQEVEMAEQKEKNGCLEDGVTYPNGSESCIDIYCFKCVDGEWEERPSIGASVDLSEVL
jgi:hypothetical protein